MEDAVRLHGVTKRYGDTVALDGLDTVFPRGVITGFLGPNGAGKTTTFRAMLGLTRPEEGEIEVLGMRVGPDTHRIVKRVGAVVEEPGLHRTHNATQNLRIAAHTLGGGHHRIPELLEFVDLTEVAERRVDGYSKGMRQRLALAMAMLPAPELLILDEPLDGLDPAGQVALKRKLRELVDREGTSIVISSHVLADVESLVDHVVVVARGREVASGPLQTLVGGSGSFRVEVADAVAAHGVLTAAGLEATQVDGGVEVVAEDGSDVARVLAESGIYPSALIPHRSSLEGVFLQLTGEGT